LLEIPLVQNSEPQNFEGFFTSTFDLPYSIFDIRFPEVSFQINLAASAASGSAVSYICPPVTTGAVLASATGFHSTIRKR
jgi:hypothetical protein